MDKNMNMLPYRVLVIIRNLSSCHSRVRIIANEVLFWYMEREMFATARICVPSVWGYILERLVNLPNSRSFSSLLASRLSLLSCRSISWFIRFCSFSSSGIQQAIALLPQSRRRLGVLRRLRWNTCQRGQENLYSTTGLYFSVSPVWKYESYWTNLQEN